MGNKDSIQNGMIFCSVRRIKSICQGRNFEIKGNHKWKGGILNFIRRAEIIIIEISELLKMKEELIEMVKIMIKEAKI